MCVIAVKPIGVKVDQETVEKMWDANSDGAGLAIMTQTETHVMKGFMTCESFWKEIEALQDCHLVLHFRLATHGAKVPKFTHPFIVSREVEIATATTITTKTPVLFHNGILGHYGSAELSDTLDFTVQALARMKSVRQMVKLLHTVSGKFTFIADGKFWNIGGFTDYKGLEVSNTNFVRSYNFYGSYGNSVYQGQKWGGGYDRRDKNTVLSVKTDSHEEGPDSMVATKEADKSVEESSSGIISVGNNRSDTEVN